MQALQLSRRELLALLAAGTLGAAPAQPKPVVSIAKIRDGRIDAAVEHAIELLGGMRAIAKGKERLLLKPNLVSPSPRFTTKQPVVETLARLMQAAHKDVSIGEGSA